jgi:hypothetical protein
VGKRAGGYYIPAGKGQWGRGGLHTRWFENFRTISSGKKKKTLILTLGSPPKKEKKKRKKRKEVMSGCRSKS